MGRALRLWVCWFVFLLVIDFIIPFTALKDVSKVTGSFLFWIVWIVVAIASMFVIFLRWKDYERGE